MSELDPDKKDPDSGFPTPRDDLDDEPEEEPLNGAGDQLRTPTRPRPAPLPRLNFGPLTSTPIQGLGARRLSGPFSPAPSTILSDTRPHSPGQSKYCDRVIRLLVKAESERIAEHERLEHSLNESAQHALEMESRFETNLEELTRMKDMLKHKEDVIEDQQRQIIALEKSLHDSRKVDATATIDVAVCTAEFEDVAKKISGLEEKLKEREDETQQYVARVTQLEETVRELEQDKQILEQELQDRDRSAHTRNDVHDELDVLRKDYHQLSEELAEMTREMRTAQENATRRISELEEEVRVAQIASDEHLAKANDLQQLVQELEQSNKNLRSELDSQGRSHDSHSQTDDRELVEWKSRYETTANELEETSKKLKVAQEMVATNGVKMAELFKKNDSLQVEHEETVKRLNEQLQLLSDDVHTLQEERDQLLEERRGYRQKLQEVQKVYLENEQLLEHNKDLDAQISSLQVQVSDLNAVVEQHGDQKQILERIAEDRRTAQEKLKELADREALLKELENCRETIAALDTKIGSISDELKKVEDREAISTKEANDVKNMNQMLIDENISLKRDAHDIKAKAEKLQRSLELAESEVRKLTDIDKSNSEKIDLLVQERDQLNMQLFRLSDLEQINKNLSDEVEANRELLRRKPSSDEIRSLNTQLAKKDELVKQLQNDLQFLQEREAQYRDAAARLDSAKYDLKTRDEAIEKLKRQLSDLSINNEHLLQQILQHDAEQKQLTEQCKNVEAVLTQEVARLRDENNLMHERLEQLESYPGRDLQHGQGQQVALGRRNEMGAVVAETMQELKRRLDTIDENDIRRNLISEFLHLVTTVHEPNQEIPDRVNKMLDSLQLVCEYKILPLEERIKGLTVNLENLRENIVKAQERESSLKNELLKLETENQELSRELIRLRSVESGLRGDLNELEERLRNQRKEHAEERRNLQSELRKLASNIEEYEVAYRDAQTRIHDLEVERDHLKSDNDQLNNAVLYTKEHLLEYAAKVQSDEEELHEKIRIAQREKENAERKTIQLQDEIDRQFAEIRELKKMLEKSEKNMEKELKTKRFNQATVDKIFEELERRNLEIQHQRNRSKKRQNIIEEVYQKMVTASRKADIEEIKHTLEQSKALQDADAEEQAHYQEQERIFKQLLDDRMTTMIRNGHEGALQRYMSKRDNKENRPPSTTPPPSGPTSSMKSRPIGHL